MKELTLNEIQMVNGAKIRPSEWMYVGIAGALVGAAAFVITAFSANPVGATFALATGAGVGMSFHAAHDILRELGL